jgi:membrane complex biogenesis BtpA family protein
MVHLGPLPGSPRDGRDLPGVIRRAVEDARALHEEGIDGILVENFFDAPFHKTNVPPATIAAMTAAVLAIRQSVPIPLGVNVLRNDVASAISIAHVCEAKFVRCNVYVGAVVADQGIIEGAAREAIQTRTTLAAEIQVWADVGVKHASPLGSFTLASEAKDAVERGLADALIVSGEATGSAPERRLAIEVKAAVPTKPVLIGSGVSVENARELIRAADGAIVGTSVKQDGKVEAPVDRRRVRALVREISR